MIFTPIISNHFENEVFVKDHSTDHYTL